MKLETEGSREELINRLLRLNAPQQESVIVPQAIPLRSRDERSQPMDAAIEAMKSWRKAIFQGKNNSKEFTLVNNDGKPYQLRMRYAKCSSATLKRIIDEKFYLPLPKYKDIVEMINKMPDNYDVNIVQKPSFNGNSWLMLHVQPKAA
jgi:hypothetical protein